MAQILAQFCTVEFRRLDQCFIDWATAVAGEGYTRRLSVTFTYQSSAPIYETLAQSTEFSGNFALTFGNLG